MAGQYKMNSRKVLFPAILISFILLCAGYADAGTLKITPDQFKPRASYTDVLQNPHDLTVTQANAPVEYWAVMNLPAQTHIKHVTCYYSNNSSNSTSTISVVRCAVGGNNRVNYLQQLNAVGNNLAVDVPLFSGQSPVTISSMTYYFRIFIDTDEATGFFFQGVTVSY
jgi:hypothetical protein